MLRSLNTTREYFVAVLVHNTVIYFIRKQNGLKMCVEKHKKQNKNETSLFIFISYCRFLCARLVSFTLCYHI